MWFVIVTFRSLLWILSSIGTFMLILYSAFTPNWLVSEEKEYRFNQLNRTLLYHNTVGLYNRCVFSYSLKEVYCRRYARDFTEVSSIAWRCCLLFISLALLILGIASLFAIASFCKQIIRRKSLMNLAGILQTFAGIFLIVVVVLYPLGWDNEQTQNTCHNKNDKNDKAEKFQLGSCSVGISYFCVIGGMAGSFFCALFSFVADKAVFSSKVQGQILEGKRLICVF